MKRIASAAAALVLLAACGDDPTALLVDLKTDLVPGLEFQAVRVEVARTPFADDEAVAEESRDLLATSSQDFLRGVRVAEFDGIAAGRTHLRVSLLEASGSAILVRLVTLQWHMCCAGTCRDTRNNNRYCGTCAVDCTAEGLTCASTGTGGYACRGCGTNAQCQRLLNSNATCYTSGSSFCNCQCAGGTTCSGGGCGSNFRCHEVSGHNYCGP